MYTLTLDIESGLIIFKLIEGTFAHSGARVEVVMDDMVFPSYSSSKARSRHTQFGETGDAVVRELEMSKITLRLIEKGDKKGEGGEDDVLAKLQGSTVDVLQRCLVRTRIISDIYPLTNHSINPPNWCSRARKEPSAGLPLASSTFQSE